MSVEFINEKGSYIWRVKEELEDGSFTTIHQCHEAFESSGEALTNLLNNHALMGIFVADTALGGVTRKGYQVDFPADEDGTRWVLKDGSDTIIGSSNSSFEDLYLATDNLIITYTLLTMFVSQVAQEKMSDI